MRRPWRFHGSREHEGGDEQCRGVPPLDAGRYRCPARDRAGPSRTPRPPLPDVPPTRFPARTCPKLSDPQGPLAAGQMCRKSSEDEVTRAHEQENQNEQHQEQTAENSPKLHVVSGKHLLARIGWLKIVIVGETQLDEVAAERRGQRFEGIGGANGGDGCAIERLLPGTTHANRLTSRHAAILHDAKL